MTTDNDGLWSSIRLGLQEPAKAANGIAPTCNEMRTAIHDGSYDSALIRQCLHTAHYAGMSGEDTYVLLAYQALVQLERTYQQLATLHNLLPVTKPLGGV